MTGPTTIVKSAGVEIAAYVDGPNDRPWIVLSNSLAADRRMWDDQMALLTSAYRVLRYDTRGHGESSAPDGPYDFAMLVADMVAVMDRFDIERADVIGFSLGGMTALGLALDHPARVARLVCADARADAPPAFVEGWRQRMTAVAEGGMGAVLDGTMERWFTPENRAARPDLVRRAGEMLLAVSPNGYIACAEALKGLDYLRRLPQLRAPTLYIRGSEDGAAPREAMTAMATATPDARLIELRGCAHISNMEDVEGFNAALAQFLGLKG
ncbi:3-oxoadipate enol-lactonase 2 [Hartmannibacter diazotrophicus]|uniref:3-oxoadipate enol-lactonase 2 n=1 Tax=Hartmannibacter diazotrophicus TaxID=1482074 RepID=A0A2C9D900_9HYPH|nr:alpha/beta fold hydrolase [Hartmannibacter diazotrophicus]SON56703.1 3-oxoadipate enol-lactonase 2 [Hartmannibacter diazotrophicus]